MIIWMIATVIMKISFVINVKYFIGNLKLWAAIMPQGHKWNSIWLIATAQQTNYLSLF